MTMNMQQQDLRPGEEEALEGLLREMTPEAEPAPEVRERIRQAVAAEWRAAVALAASKPAMGGASARAARRWQRPAMALAASLAVAAIILGIFQAGSPPAPAIAATLVRVSGPVEAGPGSGASSAWQPVGAGQALTVGQQLVTGPRGKAALSLARGVTLRLDADTRMALAGIDRVVVGRGAVYLDAGNQPTAGPNMRIDTAFGSTRHLGTQYEVRVLPAEMQVSVREGRVATAPGGATVSAATEAPVVARAGEQLVIGAGGQVTRRVVDRRDARWNWITDVTPPYAIEDRRLAEFLAWVCRETGRELGFASPDAEAAAQSIILRGSVAGLSPDDALAAVMATTNLSYRDDAGRLVVQAAVRQAATR